MNAPNSPFVWSSRIEKIVHRNSMNYEANSAIFCKRWNIGLIDRWGIPNTEADRINPAIQKIHGLVLQANRDLHHAKASLSLDNTSYGNHGPRNAISRVPFL